MPNLTAQSALRQWLSRPHLESFPLDAVLGEFRHVGKHFVSDELLTILASTRAGLPDCAAWLRRFLNTALDKYDGRFDNPSYLALHDLPLPTTSAGCPLDTSAAERQRTG